MKKSLKYASLGMISLLLLSILSTSAMASIDDYMPNEEDVEGYNLLWEADYSSNYTTINPLGTEETAEVSAGAQVWYKNDTENQVTAVIGCVVVLIEDNPLLDNIPSWLKLFANADPTLGSIIGDAKTWWDLIVAVLIESEEITDITESIETTEGSLELNFGAGNYIIWSVDIDAIIFTIAFTVSNEWISYVQEQASGVLEDYDTYMTALTTWIGAWVSIASALSGGLWASASASPSAPEASSMPSGSDTDSEDVKTVTTAIGALYEKGIPGYLPLVILGMTGVFVLYISKKKKFEIH
ncbi:MAG: hypothetical protein GF364_11525 [Candidatus Lokiarchaeota archaeon]|nr:hypothetical protein [Candidatus Lokiarchaeota archaeon]